jgi:hypothetical protein
MLTSEELFCYRCKGDAAKLGTKREIYDKEYEKQSQDRFSEVFIGTANYREMRKRNIENTY